MKRTIDHLPSQSKQSHGFVSPTKKDLSEVSKLLSAPIPSDVPPSEGAVRVASIKGYVAQKSSDWDNAETFYDQAYAGISAVKDDPCWKAELLVHHQALGSLIRPGPLRSSELAHLGC
jgi:hypothetical protein